MNLQKISDTLTRLHVISRELKIPFDDGRVIVEYDKRFGGVSDEIAINIIHPIYFPKDEIVHAIKWDETEKVTHIKRTKESDWEPYNDIK